LIPDDEPEDIAGDVEETVIEGSDTSGGEDPLIWLVPPPEDAS